MTRSPNEVDLSALEDQLRDALRKRAASTPIGARPTPMPSVAQRPPHRARRGALVLAVAAVVALVIGAIQLGRPTAEVRTTTAEEGPQPTAVPTTGEPGQVELPGAEVPRLLIDGAEVVDWEPDAAYPQDGEESEMLQAFRRPGRLDGPMIFLYTVRDLSSWGLVTVENGDPVEVRGLTGYVAHGEGAEGSTTMSVDFGDGTAIHLTARGLTDDELVGFVDGLERPGPDDPWMSPTALQGMSEVPITAFPADGRVYGADFGLPAEESFEMNLYQDGFERRLADRVSSTTGPVEMVDVDGVPAAVGAYGELDWWVMMEPEPGRALEIRIHNDRATVDWVVAHARFVDEGTWDEATGG